MPSPWYRPGRSRTPTPRQARQMGRVPSRGNNWKNIGIVAGLAATGGLAGAGFWKGLSSSFAGGLQSGLSKRVEAQVAGDKGRFASGAGYQLPLTIAAQESLQGAAATQQSESQGQYLALQEKMALDRMAWQSEENAKDRALALALSRNGDTANGHTGPLTPLRTYAKKLDTDLVEFYRRRHAKYRDVKPKYIGTTTDGRHYGSNW